MFALFLRYSFSSFLFGENSTDPVARKTVPSNDNEKCIITRMLCFCKILYDFNDKKVTRVVFLSHAQRRVCIQTMHSWWNIPFF